jgi:hypothetical protein
VRILKTALLAAPLVLMAAAFATPASASPGESIQLYSRLNLIGPSQPLAATTTSCSPTDFTVHSASNLTDADLVLYAGANCTGQAYALPSLHQSTNTLGGYVSYRIS